MRNFLSQWIVDKMAEKTNAARILDRKGIKYQLIEYQVDPDDLSATHVAETLGEPVDKVYKTLVLRGDKSGIFVAIIAADKEIDLKKAAKASGNKKAEMIAMKELLPLTGYIRGGCTALGMKKNYPIFLSKEAVNFKEIYVSGGKRGLQILLSPIDLKNAVEATLSDLIKSE